MTFADRRGAVGERVDAGSTSTPYGSAADSTVTSTGRLVEALLLLARSCGCARSVGHEVAVRGRQELRPHGRGRADPHVGLAEPVRDDPLLAVLRDSSATTTGSTMPSSDTTGRPARTELVLSAMRITYWATPRARAARSSSCCWSKYAPRRLTTSSPTRPSVTATTATNASVRRPWKVLGARPSAMPVSARRTRTRHRGSSGRRPDGWGRPRACPAGGSRGR